MRLQEHCISDRMMKSSSAACHTNEAHKILNEAHDSIYGAHQLGPKLGDRLQRLGYYWPKMIPDAISYAKRCYACQIHGDFSHQVPGYLHLTTSSWPFKI